MVEAKVPLYAARVKAGQALWLPHGYLLAEKVVGDGDVHGLKWSPLWHTPTENFIELAGCMLPSDRSLVMKNRSAAVSAKVLCATDKVCNTSHRQLLRKRVEEEFLKNDAAPAPVTSSVKRELASSQPAASSDRKKKRDD